MIFDDIFWLLVVFVYISWYSLILVCKCKTRPFRHKLQQARGPSIYRFAHSLRTAYMIHLGSRGPVAYFQIRHSLSSVDNLFIWVDSLWYVLIFVSILLHLFIFLYIYWSLLIFACICLYDLIFVYMCWSLLLLLTIVNKWLIFADICEYLMICVDIWWYVLSFDCICLYLLIFVERCPY